MIYYKFRKAWTGSIMQQNWFISLKKKNFLLLKKIIHLTKKIKNTPKNLVIMRIFVTYFSQNFMDSLKKKIDH